QLIARGVPWPYLVQLRDGTTIVLAHVRWPKGGKYPIHYTAVSRDGRKSWQEWSLRQARAPDQSRKARAASSRRADCQLSTSTRSKWEKSASKRTIGSPAIPTARLKVL